MLFALETVFHARAVSGLRRRVLNLGVGALNLALVRLIALVLLVVFAQWGQRIELGLFHVMGLSRWWNLVIGLVAMELVIYWQHRLFHVVPFLWRWHRFHHRDKSIDLTTGVRFHPVEAIISFLIKTFSALALGLNPEAIVAFTVWLAVGSFWEHADIRLPEKIDKRVRSVFVTPQVHLVHHHNNRLDHDTNFGVVLSIWDHLFGTYKASVTHSSKIGLN